MVQKVGVPIQKENEAPLGPEMRGEWGGSIPSHLTWESVVSSPAGSGAKPRPKMVLLSVDHLYRQQVLHLFILKWGDGTPLQKVGGPVPRKLCLYLDGCFVLLVLICTPVKLPQETAGFRMQSEHRLFICTVLRLLLTQTGSEK